MPKLIEQAERGEEVIIARGKVPVIRLVPVEPAPKTRSFGLHKDEAFDLAVTVEHGQRAGLPSGNHKDTFDRMLIAQALAENLPIVGIERIFDEYHVRRVW